MDDYPKSIFPKPCAVFEVGSGEAARPPPPLGFALIAALCVVVPRGLPGWLAKILPEAGRRKRSELPVFSFPQCGQRDTWVALQEEVLES